MFDFPAQDNIELMFALNFPKSLAYAPTVPLLWAMIADVADHSEYVNYRRATGFVFAGVVFALKAGLGIGGAILGLLIVWIWLCIRYRHHSKRIGHRRNPLIFKLDSGNNLLHRGNCPVLLSYHEEV